MIDPSRDGFDRRAPNGRMNPMQYQFSAEEVRVLRECNRESFFKRCLPLGTFLGLGTFYGIKSGYLKPHAKFGSAPKVIVSVIIGYFVGKISYQAKCSEKLMMLPNSQFGEMLRKRKKGYIQETLEPGIGSGMALSPFNNADKTDQYSDLAPMSDIDTTRPDHDGLDDSFRPSVDNPVFEEEMPPIQKNFTTYEELRRRNREEYQQQRTSNFSKNPPPQKSLPQTDQDQTPPSTVKTNKYGDALMI